MQLRCTFHGQFEAPGTPAACPTCLANTGQTTLMCDNHGLQVIKAGNSCKYCTMEQLANQPMHRVTGRQNASTIS
jgi:predicted amidophosphoribosyltransferase